MSNTTLQYAALAYPLPGDPMTGIVQARGLTKSFRMGDADFTVLKDLDFDLKLGEFVAIEGRSGSGKSTLLHILAGLDSADGGTVSFQGSDYTRRTRERTPLLIRILTCNFAPGRLQSFCRIALPLLFAVGLIGMLLSQGFLPEKMLHPHVNLTFHHTPVNAALWMSAGVAAFPVLIWLLRLLQYLWKIATQLTGERPTARLRNRQFGFIFQFYHLLPELNVLENTMLAPSIEHSSFGFLMQKDAMTQRARGLLEQLGLSHRLTHRPGQLSGGERQRVAIARALMNAPKVLFADEPTGNLDAETGRQIMDVLEKLHRETAQTIVMVTHDRSLAREADRVLVLKDGKLEQVNG